MRCPLCQEGEGAFYHSDARRSYYCCPRCALVFVPPAEHLTGAAEKAEYDRHQNHPDDPGYRRFLSRALEPLAERCPPPAQGLDFGCGPGPTLSLMLEEHGYRVRLYDPIYRPEPAPLAQRYDFITLTEVIEHMAAPGRELSALIGCLEPGGWLVVMTKLVIDRSAFANWHYKNDPTHVCFFSKATFDWIGAHFGVGVERADKDVVVLRRPPAAT